MTEHTHDHDEDSACAVAHEPVVPATSATAERTLVAVFASPVAGYLLRYGADMGFRGLLLEPDEARAAAPPPWGSPCSPPSRTTSTTPWTWSSPTITGPSSGSCSAMRWPPRPGGSGSWATRTMSGRTWPCSPNLASPRTRSPACTGRSGSTSAPGSRPRSPSPHWPDCSPTGTAAPADSSSIPGSSRRGIPARFARLHAIASYSICRRLDPASAARALWGASG